MKPAKERRRHQRQTVLLPLRVTERDATGRLLFQGNTVNVGAGGVYFRTPEWRDLYVGMTAHIVIDVPPEMFQLLPFGGLRGFGEVRRIERKPTSKDKDPAPADPSAPSCGVALRMTSRLRFDPDLHLPRINGNRPRPT